MAEQLPFDDVELAVNPEPRCPCVLLLDTSGSMNGERIAQLNAGLRMFRDELQADSLASQRVEVAVVTFGSEVRVEVPFTPAQRFDPPELLTNGLTPMGEAVSVGLRILAERKRLYKVNGLHSYRPWVFLITDGTPTDLENWATAIQLVAEGEKAKHFAFFAVGVEDADIAKLGQVSVRAPLTLKGLGFRELFVWLSASLRSVSRSTPGEEVSLASPAGWASV